MTLLGVFALSGLLNGLVVLGLGVFVIFHNWRDKLNRLYFLLVLAICLWSFSYWFWLSSEDADSALFWTRMLSVGSTLIPVFYFHWITSLLKTNERHKNITITAYLLACVFVLFSFSDLFVSGVQEKLFFPFWPNPGILYHFYLGILYIGLISYSAPLLIKSYKNSQGEDKKRLEYVMIGVLLAFAGGLSNFFLWYDILIPPFGNFLVVFYPLLFGYATIRYRLFNIKTIATELFIIAIWIFLFIKILLSANLNDFWINLLLFIAVVFFGILLIRSVFREVKQKERIEEAKVEDEALLGSIGDGVVAVDKESKVMFINRAAEAMLGFKPEEMIGRPYEQVLKMENEKGEPVLKEKNPIFEALNSGKKVVTDATAGPEKTLYFVTNSGQKFPAAVTVAPVILEGKIIGAVDVFRDVTVERQLDKSKSEFVSLASHQMRTPLTAIKWYSELLGKENKGMSPKQKKCVKEIGLGNERMISLIDVMLNISRFEAGKIKANPRPMDVKKFMEDIIKEQKFDVKKRKQKFVFECPNDLPEITTDQNMFKLVFQNLISNAIKYTPNEGQVSVSVEKKDKTILYKVLDTGIGIPESQKKRIFEKLFRAENAFSFEPEGNGLGLYAVKMTVENLGGKIWFESPASQQGGKEGSGTIFFVELPIAK